jgi:hypothetical protein
MGISSIGVEDEERLYSDARDKYGDFTSNRILAKCHKNFIFANTVEHAQTLRLKFEMEFDFVTYVLINVNEKEQFQYLDKLISNCYNNRFRIVFVAVNFLV